MVNKKKSWHHSKESRQLISISKQGKSLTPEHVLSIKEGIRKSGGAWNKGLTKETDERVNKFAVTIKNQYKKGRTAWCEGITKKDNSKLSHPSWNKGLTKETDKRVKENGISISKIDSWSKGLTKQDPRIARRSEKIRVSITRYRRLETTEHKNTRIEKMLKTLHRSLNVHPNKAELRLGEIINKIYPNEYRFVGDGQLVIGGKCPDYSHNIRPLLIEMFGDYWHKPEEVEPRKYHFETYGYNMIIVWEHELNDIQTLQKRILDFNQKPHTPVKQAVEECRRAYQESMG